MHRGFTFFKNLFYLFSYFLLLIIVNFFHHHFFFFHLCSSFFYWFRAFSIPSFSGTIKTDTLRKKLNEKEEKIRRKKERKGGKEKTKEKLMKMKYEEKR